jgi:GrpB-like predicted nucleotidyltransferase (UPF0157 family)
MPEPPPRPHAVEIVAYDPLWPGRAAELSRALHEALGENLITVEHFGSTSVAGLAAKPVIDLMPLVRDLERLDARRGAIEALGYDWRGEFGLVGRRFCTLSAGGQRLAHLHAYAETSPEILRHLALRDYLRLHPHAARAYEQEKRRAAALHPSDSLAYNEEKSAFVAGLEAEALAWRAGSA